MQKEFVNIPIDVYVEQVKKCCPCFQCAEEEQWETAVLNALQLWGDLTCGNWLDPHEITRHFELEPKCCECCPTLKRINLPENWINIDTIDVCVREFKGLKAKKIEVDYVFDEYTHDLIIDLTDIFDCCDCCVSYDLVVTYIVGTDKIPLELCYWFCAMAKVYMQTQEIECKQCHSLDNIAIVEVDGTKDLSATYKTLAMEYFKVLIEEYSLCFLKSLHDRTVIR